ncbi:MAG TPA: DUF3467 domain-containing protein [Thermoanaerobaculia bacterium]|nr:DUF3467 domain-containing protein [Thermoanaerobaculia bacterium]
MQENNPTIRIVMDEKLAQGEYANFANIIHSPSEFVIDMGRIMPGRPEARVCSRIIMTPHHAKQFLQALAQNVTLFEQKYGPIQIHAAPPVLVASEGEPSN